MRRIALTTAMQRQAIPARFISYPITKPPIDIEYLDSDPLEFFVRTEGRYFGFDDMMYHRELTFVRINDNPTIGQFRAMTKQQRQQLWWGCDRQDFFRWMTWRLTGTPEHLYHEGW